MKRDNKGDEGKPEGGDDIDDRIKSGIDQGVATVRQEILSDVIDEALRGVSGNPEEQKLIRFHYDNTIKQSGSSRTNIMEDIQNAWLYANKTKLLKENRELKNSLKSKNSISSGNRGANQDPLKPELDDKNFSADDKRFMEKRGMNPKEVRKTIDGQPTE